MYGLDKLIDDIKSDRFFYEKEMAKGDDLIVVKESLNKRMMSIRQQLIDEPDNDNLNFELGFCESEIGRIDEELKEFSEKYDNKETQVSIHKKIIEYNLRELYSYLDLLKKLEVDNRLINSMNESIESIEDNMSILNNMNK